MNEVDKYIQALKPVQRKALEHIRLVVKEQLPEVTESISYGMPVFKYRDKYLIGYAAFKNHLSIFPGSGPVELLSKKLEGYKLSKGTVQFTVEKPLPDSLLIEIISLCRTAIVNP